MAHLVPETSFGLSLLEHCPSNQSIIFSPLSIAFALAMIHLGAKGNTKQQINDVILRGANGRELVDHYRFLSASFLSTTNGVETKLANRMFLRDGFVMKNYYLAATATYYNAGAENLNFDKGEESSNTVNDFVNKTTNGKISEMVRPDQFRDAVAFLINALYFRADWKDKFSSASTWNDTFHSNENQHKKVEFMRAYAVHRGYAETAEVQVLSLPYADTKYAFNIFLPKEKFGLSKFLKGLTASKMQSLLKSVQNSRVTISLPKFKIENELNLKGVLEAIGVTEIFSDNGDLSGIAHNIWVSEITHKAMIEIEEKGMTAAAATVAKIAKSSGIVYRDEPTEFKANHPFLSTVTYNNHPVFIGTYY